MLELLPDVLTVKDVQEILRIGRTQTYNLINTGQLPSIRIGSAIRIPKSALLEFLCRPGYNNGEADRLRYCEGG